MRVLRFSMYYFKLQLAVLLGFYHTSHPLNLKLAVEFLAAKALGSAPPPPLKGVQAG